jgi:hypothetical protein
MLSVHTSGRNIRMLCGRHDDDHKRVYALNVIDLRDFCWKKEASSLCTVDQSLDGIYLSTDFCLLIDKEGDSYYILRGTDGMDS